MLKQEVFGWAFIGFSVLSLIQSAHAGLINGDFEQPVLGTGVETTLNFVTPPAIPGWQTTASDQKIEVWAHDFNGVPAYSGNQHVELNAFEVSTLYQDVPGIAASSIVGYQFAHRGRIGVDTMALTVTDLGADNLFGGGDDTVLFTHQFSDGNTSWGFYTGTGISALGNTTRFAFESVSAAGGDQAIGNFLDAADFGVGVAAPEPSTLFLLGSGLAAVLGFSYWRRNASTCPGKR
jgi:hypothetical protein